jgi:hypothetical protein
LTHSIAVVNFNADPSVETREGAGVKNLRTLIYYGGDSQSRCAGPTIIIGKPDVADTSSHLVKRRFLLPATVSTVRIL